MRVPRRKRRRTFEPGSPSNSCATTSKLSRYTLVPSTSKSVCNPRCTRSNSCKQYHKCTRTYSAWGGTRRGARPETSPGLIRPERSAGEPRIKLLTLAELSTTSCRFSTGSGLVKSKRQSTLAGTSNYPFFTVSKVMPTPARFGLIMSLDSTGSRTRVMAISRTLPCTSCSRINTILRTDPCIQHAACHHRRLCDKKTDQMVCLCRK